MTIEDGLNDDFRDLLIAMHDAGAEYLVVGAHAMAVHGAVRATGDLDVLVRPTPENAARVIDALVSFGAPIGEHGLAVEDLSNPGVVYQVGLPPLRIDVITSIDGATFDEAWSTRIELTIDGRHVPFLGRETLIRNKLATGREKELADAHLLQRGERLPE